MNYKTSIKIILFTLFTLSFVSAHAEIKDFKISKKTAVRTDNHIVIPNTKTGDLLVAWNNVIVENNTLQDIKVLTVLAKRSSNGAYKAGKIRTVPDIGTNQFLGSGAYDKSKNRFLLIVESATSVNSGLFINSNGSFSGGLFDILDPNDFGNFDLEINSLPMASTSPTASEARFIMVWSQDVQPEGPEKLYSGLFDENGVMTSVPKQLVDGQKLDKATTQLQILDLVPLRDGSYAIPGRIITQNNNLSSFPFLVRVDKSGKAKKVNYFEKKQQVAYFKVAQISKGLLKGYWGDASNDFYTNFKTKTLKAKNTKPVDELPFASQPSTLFAIPGQDGGYHFDRKNVEIWRYDINKKGKVDPNGMMVFTCSALPANIKATWIPSHNQVIISYIQNWALENSEVRGFAYDPR